MLTPSTIQKLKRLEIKLETSLRDELCTETIVEICINKIIDMRKEGFLSETEIVDIYNTLRSIIQEEETVLKMMLGKTSHLLETINMSQKTIQLLK